MGKVRSQSDVSKKKGHSVDLIAVSNIISTHRFGVCIDNVRMLILSNMTRCKREIRKLFDC